MGTIRVTQAELTAGVKVPLDERTRIIVVPPAAMITVIGRCFDAGKTFLLPRSLPRLTEAFAFVQRMRPKKGLVVAHVDPQQDDPEALSQERADCALAWLQNEPDVWVAYYDSGIDEQKRWGAREDRLMLTAVLFAGAEVSSAGAQAAPSGGGSLVEQFQKLHKKSLAVDGIIGPKTRKKLVEEYFALSRQARTEEQSADEPPQVETALKSHGAGAHFGVDQVQVAREEARRARAGGSAKESDAKSATEPDSVPSSRIDIILFAKESFEPQPGSADGPEYLEWVKQSVYFRDLAVDGDGTHTQLSMLLMDRTGQVRHRGAKYELTGPERFQGVTDDSGILDHDQVPPGDYELKLTLEFFNDPSKHDPRDKIIDQYTSTALVLPGDAPPQVRMLGAVPRCQLARLRGLLFETNKAFLLPSAIPDLKRVRELYEQNNPGELLVVGHTDTKGSDSVNNPLSFNRAKSTLGYLTDDVKTWEGFYTSGSKSERWGEVEDEHMRGELRRNGIQNVEGMDRTQLITEYMRLDGEDLDAGKYDITATAHGCGQHFPLDDSTEELDESPEDEKEDAADRRVELFFFDPDFGVVPKPQGELSPRGSKQYPAWRDLAEVTLAASFPDEQLLSDCDECGLLGPPGFESAIADSEVPHDVARGDEGKAVGLAQILLNDFLVQMRLAQALPAHVEPDAFRGDLDSLPTFLRIDCKFGPNTESAVKLYQKWHGELEETGTLDASTWTRLIQTTELYQHLEKRLAPPFPEVEGDVDLGAVAGLAENVPIVLASIGDTIPSAGQRCARTYSKARNFSALVTLIRDAETLLATCGVSSPTDALGVLRGIYYGTTWSADFKKEKSPVRNAGFNIYATGIPFEPKDPRPCLQCNLFDALQGSQDAQDGTRHFDWGHAIIGVEARQAGETSNILGTGHSGLEAATWLGDLGGGAAMLANTRARVPSTRARTRFQGTNFGGSINIEGDVASYLIARDTSKRSAPSAPKFSSGNTPIADAVEVYLAPGTNGGTEWTDRSKNFLEMVGGNVAGSTLANRNAVVSFLQPKIEEFGAYYLVNRLRQTGRLSSTRFRAAAECLEGASQDVAEVFVDALVHNVAHPRQQLRAVTDPPASGKGRLHPFCEATLRTVEAAEAADSIVDRLKRRLGF